jgi:hypothetical protein
MTYDEMIEKAARGILTALGYGDPEKWTQFEDVARAAFEAIGLTPECVIVPKVPTPSPSPTPAAPPAPPRS